MKVVLITLLFFTCFLIGNAQSLPEMVDVDTDAGGFKAFESFKKIFEKKGRKLDQEPLAQFQISKTEITVAQYRYYCTESGQDMPIQPAYYSNDKFPVTNLTVFDVLGYCQWLTEKQGETYRIPYLKEWLYAYFGPKQNESIPYSGSKNLSEVAWYAENSKNQIRQVSTKKGNDLGIFDLNGNLSELCVVSSAGNAPQFIQIGGNYLSSEQECTVEDPLPVKINEKLSATGFRVVKSSK